MTDKQLNEFGDNNKTPNTTETTLYQEIKQLIEEGKRHVISQVNNTLVLTYWHIGRMIKTEVLHNERAEYGKSIIKQLSQQLVADYGSGFGYANLTRMVNFYQKFPDVEKVATVSQQLSWSHFVEFLKLDDALKRDFYLSMCAHERWSVRTLRERMDGMLFERTAIAKQPEQLIRQELSKLGDAVTPSPQLFLKDPYLLDFLQLGDTPSEKNLEQAILQEIERFILEFGSDFAFMGRQKRIQIGNHDYYIDLLFYHRTLKRLVLIELKLGEFKPENKGQVELYLNWLEKHERKAGENPPIALILCANKDDEVIELMGLTNHPNSPADDTIQVSEYWLQLPSKSQLQQRLHDAVEKAQLRQLQMRANSDDASH